jgi:hypothetical protein
MSIDILRIEAWAGLSRRNKYVLRSAIAKDAGAERCVETAFAHGHQP